MNGSSWNAPEVGIHQPLCIVSPKVLPQRLSWGCVGALVKTAQQPPNLTPCLAAAEIHKHLGDICQMGTLRPTYPGGPFVPDSCMNLMSLKLRSSLRYSSFHLRTITIVEVSTFCFTALAKKLLRRCSPFPSLRYWMVNEVFWWPLQTLAKLYFSKQLQSALVLMVDGLRVSRVEFFQPTLTRMPSFCLSGLNADGLVDDNDNRQQWAALHS